MTVVPGGLDSMRASVEAFARAELADIRCEVCLVDPTACGPTAVVARAARAALERMAAHGMLVHVAATPSCEALCVLREAISYTSALADAVLVAHGLGVAPIVLAGTDETRARWVAPLTAGGCVAAFALSEGAEVTPAALDTTARRDGNEYVIDGEKTWVCNAGIADVYCVFAQTDPDSRQGMSVFAIPSGTPGLRVTERFELVAPQPVGTVLLDGCRVQAKALIGQEGDGFRIAQACLARLRPSIGAAALGLARRAFDDAVDHVLRAPRSGKAADSDLLPKFAVADMAIEIDAARLICTRAARAVDSRAPDAIRLGAMAALFGTEAAQRCIERALQVEHAAGLVRGSVLPHLCEYVRALRSHDSHGDRLRVLIAREVMNA